MSAPADPLELVCCPVCGAAFGRDGRTVRCGSGHAFDLARQGYLNLLGRAAPTHADTAEMIASRARFLAGGHFDPLADAVTALATAGGPPAPAVLEVGAGTGFYLARVLDRGGRGVALDISAAAVRRAARAHPELIAVVADVWQRLPAPSGTYDTVLAVFAPRNVAEFARVLRPGGRLVVATPRTAHLAELRASLGLLDIPAGKDERLADRLATDFDRDTRTEVDAVLELDADTLVDLVAMGPNAFHQSRPEIVDRVAALTAPQPVTLAVTVSRWLRR